MTETKLRAFVDATVLIAYLKGDEDARRLFSPEITDQVDYFLNGSVIFEYIFSPPAAKDYPTAYALLDRTEIIYDDILSDHELLDRFRGCVIDSPIPRINSSSAVPGSAISCSATTKSCSHSATRKLFRRPPRVATSPASGWQGDGLSRLGGVHRFPDRSQPRDRLFAIHRTARPLARPTWRGRRALLSKAFRRPCPHDFDPDSIRGRGCRIPGFEADRGRDGPRIKICHPSRSRCGRSNLEDARYLQGGLRRPFDGDCSVALRRPRFISKGDKGGGFPPPDDRLAP